MKRKVLPFILILLVCGISALSAQDISVSSFRALENDLTANTHGTMEKDFNGETAALIKVVTTEQGFVFDGGMVGVVKTKQGIGEIWVYVPHGIKKITIQHPQLGVLRDYYFPIPIEKARTYEMKLTTGRVITTVERKADKQYVMFSVSPANAIVELDGMPLDVDSEGYAEKSMPYGTYDYRVSCANYHTEAGKLTVSSAGKVEKTISLRPKFGWISIDGENDFHGSHVYINNERVGQLPLTTDKLASGTYRVKVVKSLYKPFEQQVTVTDNNTITLNVSLVPNFANITLTADAESEIWIDGRQRGKGKCTIGLELGEYSVEVKRSSYRTVSDVITISDIVARTIQLPSPTPIYGVLDVSSTPSRATVLVDGVEVGQTPLILDNVLVGSRKVTLQKEGYEPYEKTMMLAEEEDNTLAAILEEELIIVVEETEQEEEILQVVEIQPEFPGGMAELMKYLQKNLKYPTICQAQGIQGRVIVQFVVDSDGSIVNPEIVKPINPYLDNEALRVVSTMPKWKPGEQRGKKVRVRFTLPVTFRLEGGINGAKKTYTVNGVSFTMIDVEGGTFTMGTTSEQGSDAENDEKPAHKVTLSNYSIGETEVTQELWQAVMGRNPSNFIGNMQRPVEQVSWNECQTFIKKLNKLTGENFRLPTEAEWEFAARGGSVSKGYKYSGSNTIGDVAWFNKNSSAVHVVKSKQPNELGIYDMSGNVWEWCADKYGSYTSSAQTAPTGSSSGSDRVIRGGSWGYDEGNCRVSNRENCSPDSRGSSIGFRLAK